MNEAFAAQALACQRELGIDNAKLNVNGGAIAIGHPLGCSGARLATTLIHQMARTGASRGIASLCVGVGQGLATVFERETLEVGLTVRSFERGRLSNASQIGSRLGSVFCWISGSASRDEDDRPPEHRRNNANAEPLETTI